MDGAAGDVEALSQVVGGGSWSEIRPERLHCLLAVETVPWCEGDQLHQGGRFLQAPGVLVDGPRANRYPEAAEQPYPHDVGRALFMGRPRVWGRRFRSTRPRLLRTGPHPLPPFPMRAELFGAPPPCSAARLPPIPKRPIDFASPLCRTGLPFSQRMRMRLQASHQCLLRTHHTQKPSATQLPSEKNPQWGYAYV